MALFLAEPALQPMQDGPPLAELVPFPLLHLDSYNPNTFPYVPRCTSPLADDSACPPTHPPPAGTLLPDHKAWINVFRKSLPTFTQHALSDQSLQPEQREAAASTFTSLFSQALDSLEAHPDMPLPQHPSCHPLSCISLCAIRERCLRMAGLGDIFLTLKAQENAVALLVLPSVIQELDACTDTRKRLELALRGVFAGNIFDMGAAASAALVEAGGAASSTFATTRTALLPRPWAVDQFDTALDQLTKGSYRHVIMFVDNAGSDVVLGMIPLARELIKLGAKVVMAANAFPSINDITLAELKPLLIQAGQLDPHVIGSAVQDGRLRAVSSGNDLPVIDLRHVSRELCDLAVNECDLVILEGMGRGIETNLHATFTCDSLKLAMIKHPEVAACLGGRLYDCVCCFIPGTEKE